ncbi:hypothetical protein [Paenibacillus thiaminolyticus]|uniref:hypothetical protein n=1 Tax=Paenibacillus thiaminolyticus TaxID=49283 RepID=UPI0016044360|nr:hypothetical protein [Paenibacillus thiaminolyticus]
MQTGDMRHFVRLGMGTQLDAILGGDVCHMADVLLRPFRIDEQKGRFRLAKLSGTGSPGGRNSPFAACNLIGHAC